MRKLRFLLAVLLTALSSATAQAQMSTAGAGNPGRVRNGLPPTNTDSFVYQALEHAEDIYGDEGTFTLPPYNDFGQERRINTGIMDRRDKGLTTGHGSWLPNAWGYDEFLLPPDGEWSQSGANGNKSAPNSGGSDYYQWSGQNSNQPPPQDLFQWSGPSSNQPRAQAPVTPPTVPSSQPPGAGKMFAASPSQSGF